MAKTIEQYDVATWVNTWEELLVSKYRNEYEVAALANEIRVIFPRGANGDTQFMIFIKQNLKHCHSHVMLEKAIAFQTFDEKQWKNYGGWAGISFLNALTAAERKHLLPTLPKDRVCHYGTIRKRARKLGINSKRPAGRGSLTETEHKNQVLCKFIQDLCRKESHVLHMLTAEVKAALPAPILRVITSMTSARM